MASIPTIEVSLTPELDHFIQEQVANGKYGDAGEVVRAGLELLESDEKDSQAAFDEVRQKIQAGLEQAQRGELLDGHAVFEKLAKRIADRRNNGQ